jgi:hypothetical protein
VILDTAAFRSMVRDPGGSNAHADGPKLHICRHVFDPDEDLFGPMSDLSALGRSIAMGMRYGRGARDAHGQLSQARALIADGVVDLVEMTAAELQLWCEIERESRSVLPLGLTHGAAATIAVARERSWTVVSGDSDVAAYLHATGVAMISQGG